MSSTSGRRFRGQPDQRRQQRRDALLESALELFASRGYANTSIEEICQDAAVGYKAFYDEFATKEQLFIALYDSIGARYLPAVINALTGDLTPPQQLRTMISSYLHALMEDPRAAKVLFVTSAGVSEAVDLHRRAAHRAFASFFAQIFSAGLVSDSKESSSGHGRALSMGVAGGMGEIVVDYLLDPDQNDVDTLVDALYQFVDTFIRGLGPRDDQPPSKPSRTTRSTKSASASPKRSGGTRTKGAPRTHH